MTKRGRHLCRMRGLAGVLWWVMSEWLAGRWLKAAYEGFKSGFEERLNLDNLINWPIKSLLYIGPKIS